MIGFYKNDGGVLLEAPNYVYSKDYTLLIEKKDEYEYPVDGWKYFDSRELAIAEYGIVEVKEEEPAK